MLKARQSICGFRHNFAAYYSPEGATHSFGRGDALEYDLFWQLEINLPRSLCGSSQTANGEENFTRAERAMNSIIRIALLENWMRKVSD